MILMTTLEILTFLQKDIHSTVFATVDDDGLPQTCVIDLMLADETGLYFLTAKGKEFYRRLVKRGYVALSGMKGEDTMSTVAISLRGPIRSIGQERLDEIFAENPYMASIYPSMDSRRVIEVFHIYAGVGECFDMRGGPIQRRSFSFGGTESSVSGYQINPALCTGCQSCLRTCPVKCISGGTPCAIDLSRCIHCGNCTEACPVGAVERLHKRA